MSKQEGQAQLTEKLQHVVWVAASTPGNALDAGGLLQDLDVVLVQLLLRHAVHERHELAYPCLALIFPALQSGNFASADAPAAGMAFLTCLKHSTHMGWCNHTCHLVAQITTQTSVQIRAPMAWLSMALIASIQNCY